MAAIPPNPNPGGDNPGGGDNPAPGGDGENTNPSGGSGGSGGGSSSSGGGDSGGGDTNPDGGNGAGNTGDFTSENIENTQATAGTEISSAQAGSNVAGVTTAGASGQTADVNGAAGGKEPKTGDTAYWEVYATLAMVAGLTYLLLYIMEESRGMTEREKEAAVAALIRWGKKGGAFRKCCAMAAIFGLLMYYHAIGKRAGESALRDKYLGQAF